MAGDLSFLPAAVADMVENYGSNMRLALVEELEAEHAIFVQDGNHGEYRPLQDGFVAHGVPFVRPGNLLDGRIDLSGCDRINEVAFQRVRKGIGKGGDIVLTTNATIVRVAITPLDAPVFVTNPQTTVWRSTNPEILNQYYLFCFMRSLGFQEQLRMHTGRNATFDYISLTKQRGLTIPLPPLGEQKAIAAVLGALDDKIEMNRRMNATLEAMARALFQSWFVDFDPVRAKLDGRQPPNVDPATAALFPEHFAHSEHDMLPVGWRHAAIEEVCAINAWTLSKNDALETLEYVEISEVTRGNILNIATYARGEEPSRARRRLCHGDTVLSTVRPNRGSYFLALNPPENRVASTGFAVLGPTTVPWSFLHAALTQPEVSDHLGQMADGGAYPAVRPEIIGAMQVALPNEPRILEAFHRTCAPLLEQSEANRIQSGTLATLRDTLLPKLLSGELSVTPVEMTLVNAE